MTQIESLVRVPRYRVLTYFGLAVTFLMARFSSLNLSLARLVNSTDLSLPSLFATSSFNRFLLISFVSALCKVACDAISLCFIKSFT